MRGEVSRGKMERGGDERRGERKLVWTGVISPCWFWSCGVTEIRKGSAVNVVKKKRSINLLISFLYIVTPPTSSSDALEK